MRLRALTLEQLTAHGMSEPFARILIDPDSYDPDLSIHVGKSNWDYFIPEGVSDVVPLWDENANSFVRWKRNGITEYVWLFHDDPNWALVARSEQGIMAKLWQRWAEFQESDDECRRFADAIGFRHCDRGLGLLALGDDSFEVWARELSD